MLKIELHYYIFFFFFFLQRATQSAKEFGKKGQSINQSRKIRKYDEAFDRNTFGQEAQDIYIKAHELLNELVFCRICYLELQFNPAK